MADFGKEFFGPESRNCAHDGILTGPISGAPNLLYRRALLEERLRRRAICLTVFQSLEARALAQKTMLNPPEINDAVTVLERRGHVRWLQSLGDAPFKFTPITITAHGRLKYEAP